MRSAVACAWLIGIGLTACGAENIDPTARPFSLTEVMDTVSPGVDAGPPAVHTLTAPVNLVAGGADYVIASTSQGPYRLVGTDDPVEMDLVTSQSRTQMGPLVAVASRQVAQTEPATGIVAVSSSGVLQDFTDYFEVSPASSAIPGTASALDDNGSGDSEVLWVGIAGGVVRSNSGGSKQFTFDGQSNSPSAVLEVNATLALVAFDHALYELNYLDGTALLLPYDFGHVAAMARGNGGSALLATDHGLYVRNGQGGYQAHLDHDANYGHISGLTFDPINGAFFAAEGALLQLANDGTLTTVGSLPDPGPHSLGLDGFGDVWVGSGSAVLQFHAGSPVTYTNQLKPFFAQNCYSCHVTGTQDNSPRLPLDDYNGTKGLVDTIIQRVSGAGGAPMPPPPPVGSGQLAPSQYGIIIRWARSGEQP
jgi:hypothetical protein